MSIRKERQPKLPFLSKFYIKLDYLDLFFNTTKAVADIIIIIMMATGAAGSDVYGGSEGSSPGSVGGFTGVLSSGVYVLMILYPSYVVL